MVHPNAKLPSDAQGAAGYYLNQGYIPIPVLQAGWHKAPKLEHWQSLRPHPEDLVRLFPAQQRLNVGLLLGVPSQGLVDVDLDCQEAVRAAGLLLPSTGWVSGRAGRPRSHWWYRLDAPPDKASEKFCDLDQAQTCLLELRSTGGQTVVPPSIHESGECIVWDCFDQPAQIDLATLRLAVATTAACTLLARYWPGKGVRQDAVLALTGALLRLGWEVKCVEQFVAALCLAVEDEESNKRVQAVRPTSEKLASDKKTTGWPRLEKLLGTPGRAIVRQCQRWLASDSAPDAPPEPWPEPIPFEAPPVVPPFPTDVFPPKLVELVRDLADCLNAPTDFVGVSVLALAAGAVGNTVRLRISASHTQPALVFAALIGLPGSAKSPVLKFLTRPFDQIQVQFNDEYAQALERFKNAGEGERVEVPVLRVCVTRNITSETLGLLLQVNPRGFVMPLDELSGLFSGLNQYKGGRGNDRQMYLSIWPQETIDIKRKSDLTKGLPPIFVENPCLSILGGIQPDLLTAIRGENIRGSGPRDDGGLDRFLLTWPDVRPEVGERWREVRKDLREHWSELVRTLLIELQGNGFLVDLSEDARREWERFTHSQAAEVNHEDFPGHLRGPWQKLRGYAGRLALTLHLLDWASTKGMSPSKLSGRTMANATRLVDYFKAHARKVHGSIGTDTRSEDAQKIARWLRKQQCERFQKREVHQALKSSFRTIDSIEPILEVLENHHLIRSESSLDRAGPGRKPSPWYEVNPGLLATSSSAREVGDDDQNAPNDFDGYANDSATSRSGHPFSTQVDPQNSQNSTQTTYSGNCGNSEDRILICHERTLPCVKPSFLVVEDPTSLEMLAGPIEESRMIALALETTGLNPRTDRVRLLSLNLDTIDGGRFSYLVDCFHVDPKTLWSHLATKPLLMHNALFDLTFLAYAGFIPKGPIHDTMLRAQILSAGTREKVDLDTCVGQYLGRNLDQELQGSDRSGPLTEQQLGYAVRNVEVLPQLHEKMLDQLRTAKLESVAFLEERVLPLLVTMATHGVGFDVLAWQALAARAQQEEARQKEVLDAAAPCRPGSAFPSPWNWDSPHQVKEALSEVGIVVDSTGDDVLATLDHPLAVTLRNYRDARKRATTYGRDWLNEHVREDGRVYPSWWQIGASSGRMSCSQPNMQQLPRGEYRKCIVAPTGRVLVKADYSQIELRIAAKISGDKALLEAYQRGEDLHVLTARQVLKIEEVTKQDRQLAKALNFGLLYGMGAKGFRQYAQAQYGVTLSEQQAQEYRAAFFRSYPGLARWHRQVGAGKDVAVETWTLAGRRRVGVLRFTEKLNTPVQGTGADGLKLALALLWERRDEMPGAFPVLVVHDEIVVECDEAQAEAVTDWLKKAMLDGMSPLIEPVPVEVEAQVVKTWGGD